MWRRLVGRRLRRRRFGRRLPFLPWRGVLIWRGAVRLLLGVVVDPILLLFLEFRLEFGLELQCE